MTLYHASLVALAIYTKPNGAETVRRVDDIGAVKVGTEIEYVWEIEIVFHDPANPGDDLLFDAIAVDTKEQGEALVRNLRASAPWEGIDNGRQS